ncbi:Pentatricopeptide repeat [Dillenia turbinata]|uniref:Pentatricopeptide repeat n=1 Tax=Dillenia turbinata TaxID=194707 RepID=A0AAN8YT18_9MAGN
MSLLPNSSDSSPEFSIFIEYLAAIQFKRGLARVLGLNLVTGAFGLNIRALCQFPPLIGFPARARSSTFCNQNIGWFSNSFEIVHVRATAELARCCINKLLSLKVKPPSFSTSILHFKSHRTISTQCIELEKEEEEDGPRNYSLQSILRHPNPEISCFFQKGFSEITTPIDGSVLHALCITASIKLSTFHMNTLINMYNKFDNIAYACYLFDTLPHRNESSWNTMISGFVRAGFFSEAIDLFRAMIQDGFHPNGFVVASLITACNRAGKFFERGLQVHGFVLKLGLLYDVFVSTALLHFYGAYGYTSDARRFFEEMPYRNVVSWTSLMVAYSEIGNPSEVLQIYKRLRSEGVECNQNTYATVISSCGLLEDENLGHQVLGHVIKSGLDINVSVANSFISMFGNFNSMEEAVYIFHNMNDYDVISWNSIISAYAHNGLCEDSLECFHQMRHGHYKPDSTTLSSLLVACSSTDNFEWGKGIHGLVVKVGLDSNICVSNTLLTMYSEVEGSDAAESLFQNMIDRDLISWNCMMTCYAQDGKSLSALQLLAELLWTGKSMNHVTFAGAISACSKPNLSAEGKILHALVNTIGLHDNLVVGNALITMYGKYGKMTEADQVSKIMCVSDLVTWNALIGGYAENEQPNEALKVFKFMREGDEDPNYITFVNVLGAFTSANGLVNHGMPIHAQIVLKGFESNDYVKNSLITMYAECGDLKSSNIIFDGLAYKSSVTWNAMVAANARHGCGEEALKLFRSMRYAGVGLDQFSFSGALAATANLAMLEEGQQLHSLFIKLGFDSNIHVINAATDMYAKCGEMDLTPTHEGSVMLLRFIICTHAIRLRGRIAIVAQSVFFSQKHSAFVQINWKWSACPWFLEQKILLMQLLPCSYTLTPSSSCGAARDDSISALCNQEKIPLDTAVVLTALSSP